MALFRILYEDENLIAVDKPAGIHVHPPEDTTHRIPKHQNGLAILRDQTGAYVYPIHRIDRATSGVVLYAKNAEFAGHLGLQFQNRKANKEYVALVRGWIKGDSFVVDSPLEDETGVLRDAWTGGEVLSRIEIPIPIGKYPVARYSLVRVKIKTGRRHQIRRHLRRIGHPLIGDTLYGVGEHNRFFRTHFGSSILFLKAFGLEWNHPHTGEKTSVFSKWSGVWHRIFELAGVCPWGFSIPLGDCSTISEPSAVAIKTGGLSAFPSADGLENGSQNLPLSS